MTIDHPPADGDGERFINVDDCERVTRQLQHVLEVEGLAYERLEVSSPGLDRPLKTAADFQRFLGEQVEVTLKVPFKGRKRFRGELHGARRRLAHRARRRRPRSRRQEARGQPVGAGARRRRPGTPAPTARPASEEKVLDFSLDEVREARLVPVIDFKGRSVRPAGRGDAARRARTKRQTEVGFNEP